MSVNSIYKLLDKLEMMILKGAPIPFSPFVIVNHEKLIDILDKIRASIPGEIQEAHSIIRQSEDIQAEAQKRATIMLAEARDQAEKILSESELLKAVQAEADKIREEVINEVENVRRKTYDECNQMKQNAVDEAIKIREGADQYAESILSKLDNELGEMHSIIKNGQKHLANAKSESIASMKATRNETTQNQNRELSYKIEK